jgi:hypothetical protein
MCGDATWEETACGCLTAIGAGYRLQRPPRLRETAITAVCAWQ